MPFPAKLAKKLSTYRLVKRAGADGCVSINILNLNADKMDSNFIVNITANI